MVLTAKDKIRLYSDLATFVRSGFGIDHALRSLLDQRQNPARTKFLEHVRRSVRQGATLSDGIATAKAGVGTMEISIIRAAELAGMLDQGFEHLSDHFETLSKTRREIKLRLIYPGFLVHLAIALPTIPRAMFSHNLARELTLTGIQFAVVYALCSSIVFGLAALFKVSRTKESADRIARLLPLIGPARRSMALQRFCGVFKMYIECGQKISAGVAAGGEASESAVIHAAANDLADTARAGSPVGTTILSLTHAFPRELGSAIQNAELSGTLGEELGRWTRLYRERVGEQFQLIGIWTPRIVFFFAAIFVACQIIAMYLGTLTSILDQFDQFG